MVSLKTSRNQVMRDPSEVIEDALERGARLKVALITKAGELLSAESVAALLQTSKEDVMSRTSLLAVANDGQLRWPSFQFESQIMAVGVEKVLAAIAVDELWAQLNFFFLNLQELGGRTPVKAIRKGDLDAVILAARHFGEHGAS